jgi:hypothetical protein
MFARLLNPFFDSIDAKLTANGFRPALLGGFALLFIAGFSLTLIKLVE